MNPFDAMQSLADLWNKGGKAQGLLGPGIANWLAEHDQDAAPGHVQQ